MGVDVQTIRPGDGKTFPKTVECSPLGHLPAATVPRARWLSPTCGSDDGADFDSHNPPPSLRPSRASLGLPRAANLTTGPEAGDALCRHASVQWPGMFLVCEG
jgi:hypothetical protein